LGWTAEGRKWLRWHWNALVLPAEVGWPMFLRLWKTYNMSLPIVMGRRELLRVEVLEARANGEAEFRLWYYKWQKTRPQQPYMDIEIKSYSDKYGRIHFVGFIYSKEAEGISKDHLAEIADLLKREGIGGVSLRSDGKGLRFTGAFRDSVLAKLGVKPELPQGEPPAVQHLGGFRFKIGGREVEFARRNVRGVEEFYAELTFPSREKAERFASSLGAIGVYAEVRENMVRLDSDAFFGLLAATNVVPPGLKLLYRSEEDDFRVYASVEEGRMRFYFAVKHEGAWRVAEGLYKEWSVELWRKERDVLEAVRDAVEKALKQPALKRPDRSAEMGEPKEVKDEKGNVAGHCLYLYGPHVTPFLEHAAETVEAKPAEVRLEGKHIVISAGGVEAAVEFKLLKSGKAEFLMARDVERTLALYRSLKDVGVPVEITPKGVKIDGEALWSLIAVAVERNAPSVLPAEVMPGVELLKVYNIGGMKMYIFRAEGVHYYFAVKTEREWRVAGGKYVGRQVRIFGETAPAVADAINALYREMGVERRVEVRYDKNRVPYIHLTNVDLGLLDLR